MQKMVFRTALAAVITVAFWPAGVFAQTAVPPPHFAVSLNSLENVTPSHLYKSADDWLYGQTGYTFESLWGYVRSALVFVLTETISLSKKVLSFIQ